MDSNFKSEMDALLAERHGDILTKFRKEHAGHRKFTEQIAQAQQNLESIMTKEQIFKFKHLLVMLTVERESESKYLYVKGMTDGGMLLKYLDAEFINPLYKE